MVAATTLNHDGGNGVAGSKRGKLYALPHYRG